MVANVAFNPRSFSALGRSSVTVSRNATSSGVAARRLDASWRTRLDDAIGLLQELLFPDEEALVLHLLFEAGLLEPLEGLLELRQRRQLLVELRELLRGVGDLLA
jgi:hypothetical protein